MKNLLSINSLTQADLLDIFNMANLGEDLLRSHQNTMTRKILATYFRSESFRTSMSFMSAFYRMGGNTINATSLIGENQREESLKDIGKLIGNYCDAIVVRCPESDHVRELAFECTVPIISAGHGQEEHPSVGISQTYSIAKRIGKIDNLSILIIAKLPKRGVNSLLLCLANWTGVHVTFLTSRNHFAPKYIIEKFTSSKENKVSYIYNMEEIEDFSHFDAFFIDDSNSDHQLDEQKPGYWNPALPRNFLDRISQKAYITAGLPRTRAIPKWLDHDPRSVYFKKSNDALYIRAAILIHLLS